MSKINTGTIALLFLAILFGLSGTYALRVAMQGQEAPAPATPTPRPVAKLTVPMASRDIKAGTTLIMDDIALFTMTREQVRKRVGSKVFMTLPDQIIGKTLLTDLKSGSVFNTKDFYPLGRGPGITRRLNPGLRALTIQISPVNALLGFAGPGEKVDVLFHYGQHPQGGIPGSDLNGYNPPLKQGFASTDNGGNTGYRNGQYNWGRRPAIGEGIDNELQSATSTLVQDVEILALGSNSTPSNSSTGLNQNEIISVTLAVNPRQAELIRVAEGHGQLSLTLRGPEDSKTVPLVDPVTVDQIVKLKTRVSKMEIYRGTKKSQLHFQHGKTIERKVFSGVAPNPASSPPGVSKHLPIHSGHGFPANGYRTADVKTPDATRRSLTKGAASSMPQDPNPDSTDAPVGNQTNRPNFIRLLDLNR